MDRRYFHEVKQEEKKEEPSPEKQKTNGAITPASSSLIVPIYQYGQIVSELSQLIINKDLIKVDLQNDIKDLEENLELQQDCTSDLNLKLNNAHTESDSLKAKLRKMKLKTE